MSSFTPQTIDQLVQDARRVVNDSLLPYRNSDDTYVDYLNEALLAVYSVRPDAFIGNFQQGILSFLGVIQYTTADLQMIDGVANPTPPVPPTPFPIDTRFFYNPVVAYVGGRIELADDEFTDQSRSAQLLASMSMQLTGH